jgi:proline iminopeptidase
MVKAYARIFTMTPKNKREQALQDEAALAWTVWEGSTAFLAQDLSDLGSFSEPAFAKAFAQIENHYFMNGAFFTGTGARARKNNYLLDNIRAITKIPIHIVQGQYDLICPRFQADALVHALKKYNANVNYIVTAAGHGAHERETMLALQRIMDNLP